MKINREENFEEGACEETSDKKKITPKDLALFKDHALRQDFSFADVFLGRGSSSSTPTKRTSLLDDASNPKKKPKNSVQLERELPKMFTAMEKSMSGSKGDVGRVLGSGELAWGVIRSVNPQFLNLPSTSVSLTSC